MRIKVATANVAGAARAEKGDPCKFELLASLLGDVDLIGLQEVVKVIDPSNGHIIRDDIKSLTNTQALSGYQCFFFPHLDSRQQPHPRKWTSPVFQEYYTPGYQIYQGTAILLAPAHTYCHLFQDDIPGCGVAQIIPWYETTPTFYRGNRDTEPRSLLIARVRIGSQVILFCSTQLSTLTEENTDKGRVATDRGIHRRKCQTEWIVDYLQDYRVVRREFSKIPEPIVLVGDFNTEPHTEELRPFQRFDLKVVPIARDGIQYTHRTHHVLMDIIFAPPEIIVKEARIINLGLVEAQQDRRISDHHPVIAELNL